VALYALPERTFDPSDIGLVEDLIPTNRREVGLAIVIPRMLAQPILQPARRLAQLRGRFVKGLRAAGH
jgi:hypothetical protein